MLALRQWGEAHLFARGEQHSELIDKRTGKAEPLMTPKASDGKRLQPARTEVRKVS